MMDSLRSIGMRVGWVPAAAIALILLGLSRTWHAPQTQRPPFRPAAPQTEAHPSDVRPTPERRVTAAGDENTPLGPYDDIVRAAGPDDEQLLLLTFQFPNPANSIQCVDAVSGSVKWQRPPVRGGRYTDIRVGEFTLVECTGFPEENTLAVRRLSDGHILGRAWTLAKIYDFAISGRRVATVEPVVILHGREIPVTSMGETPEGPWATRVRVYDEWGHMLSARHVPDGARLTGFPRGFAVASDAGTILLTGSGRRLVTLR